MLKKIPMNLIKGFIICSLLLINFNQSKAQIFLKRIPELTPTNLKLSRKNNTRMQL
jgi:hypothetical protein